MFHDTNTRQLCKYRRFSVKLKNSETKLLLDLTLNCFNFIDLFNVYFVSVGRI